MKGITKNQVADGRPGERIGGGFVVFRRGKTTGRVSIKNTLPFEHASYEEALIEADRLARRHPGETFQVFASAGVPVGPYAPTPAGGNDNG